MRMHLERPAHPLVACAPVAIVAHTQTGCADLREHVRSGALGAGVLLTAKATAMLTVQADLPTWSDRSLARTVRQD